MPVARQPEGPADAAGTWSQRELESAALPALDSSAKWGYQPLRALPPGIAEQLHAVQTKYFESILRPRVPLAPLGLSFLEVTWARGGAGNGCRPWAAGGRGGTERLGPGGQGRGGAGPGLVAGAP